MNLKTQFNPQVEHRIMSHQEAQNAQRLDLFAPFCAFLWPQSLPLSTRGTRFSCLTLPPTGKSGGGAPSSDPAFMVRVRASRRAKSFLVATPPGSTGSRADHRTAISSP